VSHFYADIQGNRGKATRGGSKESGIQGHIRGWSVGVRVYVKYDKESDRDIVTVYKTSGSNGNSSSELIAKWCDVLRDYHRICDGCISRFKCFTE